MNKRARSYSLLLGQTRRLAIVDTFCTCIYSIYRQFYQRIIPRICLYESISMVSLIREFAFPSFLRLKNAHVTYMARELSSWKLGNRFFEMNEFSLF